MNTKFKFALSTLFCALLYSPAGFAAEQVFKINNTLANINIEAETFNNIEVIKQLIQDIKNDGLKFTFKGTKVSGETFTIVEPKLVLKKQIFEKYEKNVSMTNNETLWQHTLDQLETNTIFNLRNGVPTPALNITVELLDKDGKRISSTSFLDKNYNRESIFYLFDFFDIIKDTKKNNQSFNDLIILPKNINFDLTLDQIQKIDTIRFNVKENTDRKWKS